MCTMGKGSISTVPALGISWMPSPASPKASFCVVGRDEVIPEKYTTYFRSVIAFGRVRVVEDEAQKRAAIDLLAANTPRMTARKTASAPLERDWKPLCMLEMEIDHLSGKEAIELTRRRMEP